MLIDIFSVTDRVLESGYAQRLTAPLRSIILWMKREILVMLF